MLALSNRDNILQVCSGLWISVWVFQANQDIFVNWETAEDKKNPLYSTRLQSTFDGENN